MSTKVHIDMAPDLIERAQVAAERATKAVMTELFAAFQQSFSAQAWEWPRETERGGSFTKTGKRTRGSVVFTPRNIIDSATLRRSGAWSMTNAFEATFTWSASYATAVHEGAEIQRKDGTTTVMPARPWTRAVLGSELKAQITPYPMQERLKEVWLQRFRSNR